MAGAMAAFTVNDAFVMSAWNKSAGSEDITMLADGNGDFAEAMDLVMDGSGIGLGKRSKRYAAVIEDGVITSLDVEEPGKMEVSVCEAVIQKV